MKSLQSGLATVEFAIVGVAALTVLIGCIEIGRLLFVWNSVGEATRRAARLATVSPCGSDIAGAAQQILDLAGLTSGNGSSVDVTYLSEDGAAMGCSFAADYVSVGISGYEHTLLIPFVGATVAVPAFQTTLPVESLGYIPESG